MGLVGKIRTSIHHRRKLQILGAHARRTVAVHPQEVQQDACTDDLIIRLPSTERLAKMKSNSGAVCASVWKISTIARIMTADRSVNTVHRDEFSFSWKSAGS